MSRLNRLDSKITKRINREDVFFLLNHEEDSKTRREEVTTKITKNGLLLRKEIGNNENNWTMNRRRMKENYPDHRWSN